MSGSIVSKRRFTNSRDTSFSDNASQQALKLLEVSELMKSLARIQIAKSARTLIEQNEVFAALGLDE